MGTDARTLPTEGTLVDGRYLLGTQLGEGTFGGVWRARDARLSNRLVAVKFLKPDFHEQAETVARFDAEADALAQVPHPNIVTVLDRGTWQSLRFIVTEYVEGRSLSAWIEEHRTTRSRTDIAAVLSLFDQLCAAIEAAHAVRTPGAIVHRDLKPDNVIVRALPNGELTVKVLDFGIAQLGRRSGTQSGALLGTPLYMAPEQAFGNNNAVGPWTDVFALGVIVTEMFTLHAQATSTEPWWGTALQHGREVRAMLGRMRADVPAVIWDVVAKCLQAQGSDRYPDAGTLRAAMRQASLHAFGVTSTSQPPWAPVSTASGATAKPAAFAQATAPTAAPAVSLSDTSISVPPADADAKASAPEAPSRDSASKKPTFDWTRDPASGPAKPPEPLTSSAKPRVSVENATAPPAISVREPARVEKELPWVKLAAGVAFGAILLAAGILALIVRSDGRRAHPQAGARADGATQPARPLITPTPPVVDYRAEPGASPVSTNAALYDFLQRWHRAVARRPGAQPLSNFYAPRFRYHGRGGPLNLEDMLDDLNANVRAGGSFDIDWAHSEWIEETPDMRVVPEACRDAADASGNVIKVRPWAVEVKPSRIASIGCARLEGRYLLRLRQTAAGLRICHESWTVEDGICASCPTARECNR